MSAKGTHADRPTHAIIAETMIQFDHKNGTRITPAQIEGRTINTMISLPASDSKDAVKSMESALDAISKKAKDFLQPNAGCYHVRAIDLRTGMGIDASPEAASIGEACRIVSARLTSKKKDELLAPVQMLKPA